MIKFIGSNIGENIHATIREKEVSIQNIAYFTSNANATRHETGNTTHNIRSR
ncbi:MAG: hypothetical protein V3V70_10030 [Candidatus Scalindua sp.]